MWTLRDWRETLDDTGSNGGKACPPALPPPAPIRSRAGVVSVVGNPPIENSPINSI
jgi:hypothetical protein